ncbi:MAG: putative Aurora kinase [Streblomastix strix]|uniref:Putative Aurora kinase n=1 Tax=Streblomastix strix TaxID=222440 RepID=A0A5J4VDH7_9EUKA|nr:MAG: putative Aurora kinase [Streblomastix strix]
MPKFEDYEIVRQLKSGQNCRTFLVKLKRTGELYVMKRVQLNAGDKGSVEEHINAMKQYEPRFITKLICTAINEKEFYRIYEYYPKGDLHKVISDLHHLTQEERLNRVWEIFSYIVRSLDNLHSQGFSHFNLKPQNILVLEDGSVRLDDFIVGSDIQVKDYYTKVEGSKIYMAPEVLSLKKIDSTSDIFSLSVIIAELLIGHHPFIGKNDKDTIEKIQKSQFELLPDWIDSELKEILLQMIDIDSDKRPTTSTILQTEKIKDILQRFDENEDITETSEEKVKQMKTEFCSLKQTTMISYNLVKKLELGLETSRYIRCGKVKKMTFDMYETAREINEICSTIVFNVIQIEEDVELADQTNLIHEIVDLVKNVTLDDITHDMVNAIEKISNFGSAQLNHKIFEMGLIQSLVPNIKYYNREMQQGLILTFSHIIRKGWKQPRLSSLTELQTQQKLTSGSEPSSTTSSSLQIIQQFIAITGASIQISV